MRNKEIEQDRNVCFWRTPRKGGAFQWPQAPPGNRSSRKQPEQSWRYELAEAFRYQRTRAKSASFRFPRSGIACCKVRSSSKSSLLLEQLNVTDSGILQLFHCARRILAHLPQDVVEYRSAQPARFASKSNAPGLGCLSSSIFQESGHPGVSPRRGGRALYGARRCRRKGDLAA